MSYIKHTFTRFKNFITDSIITVKSIISQFTPRNLKQIFQVEYADLKAKLSDLKGTNWDLAQYHFVAGNYNDAIMRFKILQKNKYKLIEIYYFLGRIYLEKGKPIKAKEYLNAYLSSQNNEYRIEAEYCISIINSVELNTIPNSIIKNKRDRTALNLERSNMDVSLLNRYNFIINILKSEINQGSKVLEIGCYIGIFGRIFRETFSSNIQYFEGREIGAKAAAVASAMHINQNMVYDKITSYDNISEIVSGNSIYSVVLVPDILAYYCDLVHIFLRIFLLLDNSGIALFVARVLKSAENTKNSEFIHPIEEFRYSHSYIIDTAAAAGFKLKESYDIGDGFEAYVFKKVQHE